MDPDNLLPPRWKRKISKLEMTMPSFVVYGTVKKSVIPEGTLPVQMFVDNREALDEGDVTIYLPSLEDPTLAPEGWSTFLLIGPSLRPWPKPGEPEYGSPAYLEAKGKEADRMLSLVERRMPGFIASLGSRVEASPTTIWRYLGKVGGAVAGPKQKMGQHLILRQKARGPVDGLYFAGESTVMGTGTPAVTVSGISAANRILRDYGLKPFTAGHGELSAVTVIPAGTRGNVPKTVAGREATRCRWCEAAPGRLRHPRHHAAARGRQPRRRFATTSCATNSCATNSCATSPRASDSSEPMQRLPGPWRRSALRSRLRVRQGRRRIAADIPLHAVSRHDCGNFVGQLTWAPGKKRE
jgi:hypothetical protein